MFITIQLTSHAEKERGENERLAEIITLEFKRNGQKRTELLRAVTASIKLIAESHNARFNADHSGR